MKIAKLNIFINTNTYIQKKYIIMKQLQKLNRKLFCFSKQTNNKKA